MPRTPQDRTKVNLFLQSDVLAALKKMATIRGTTYSDLVRDACRRYVVSEGAKLVKEQQQMAAMQPSKPIHPGALPDESSPREPETDEMAAVERSETDGFDIDPRERE